MLTAGDTGKEPEEAHPDDPQEDTVPDSDARPPRRAPGSRAPEQDRAADNPWRTEGLPRSGDGKGRGPRNPGRARLWTAVLVGYLVVFGLLTLQRGRDPARQ